MDQKVSIDKLITLGKRLRDFKAAPDYGKKNALLKYLDDFHPMEDVAEEVKAVAVTPPPHRSLAYLASYLYLTQIAMEEASEEIHKLFAGKLDFHYNDLVVQRIRLDDQIEKVYASFDARRDTEIFTEKVGESEKRRLDRAKLRHLLEAKSKLELKLRQYCQYRFPSAKLLNLYWENVGYGLRDLITGTSGDDFYPNFEQLMYQTNKSKLVSITCQAVKAAEGKSVEEICISVAHTVARYAIAHETEISACIPADLPVENPPLVVPEDLLDLSDVGKVVPVQAGYYLLHIYSIIPERLHSSFWKVFHQVAPRCGLTKLFYGEVSWDHLSYPMPNSLLELIQAYDIFHSRDTVIQRLLSLPCPVELETLTAPERPKKRQRTK